MLLLLLCVIFSVIGQLMLKKGMLEVGGFQGSMIVSYFLKSFTNIWVLIALFLYVISLGLWLIVLSRERLGFAYLLFGLTYVFLPLASWRFLGERLTSGQIVGMILIAVGVIIVGSSR